MSREPLGSPIIMESIMRSMFGMLLAVFLSLSAVGQVRVTAFGGVHVPLTGMLSTNWNSGLDLNLGVEAALGHSLFFRGTIRQSTHSFAGDSAGLAALGTDYHKLVYVIEGNGSNRQSENTKTYDISGECEYQFSIIPRLAGSIATGMSCSINQFGDATFYTVGQYIPPFVPAKVQVRVIFSPEISIAQVVSAGIRIDLTETLGVSVQGRYFNSYNGMSSCSVVAGITYSLVQ